VRSKSGTYSCGDPKSVVEAFNDDDWDAARKLLGDSTYNELGTQRSLDGADAIVEALQGWKTAMPDVTWEGTQTGEMVTEQGTIPPSGKRQKTPSAFIFDYENGELKESRHYFDMLTFLKQIGAA
jgi:predicted ester cyclase